MAEGKILPYLDIPFQHASPRVLKAMKRPAAQREDARADRPLARDLPGHRHPLDLHRRLSRRDRGRIRGAARLARRGEARPRRLLPLRAGRRRARQRPPRSGSRRGQGEPLAPLHAGAAGDQRAQAQGEGRPARAGDRRRDRRAHRPRDARRWDAPEIDGAVHLDGRLPIRAGEIVTRADRARRRLRPPRSGDLIAPAGALSDSICDTGADVRGLARAL